VVVSSSGCFIKWLFHQVVVSSSGCFINWLFHQLVVSSTGCFITWLFHQLVVSSTGCFITSTVHFRKATCDDWLKKIVFIKKFHAMLVQKWVSLL
jgi:hypothetical protein